MPIITKADWVSMGNQTRKFWKRWTFLDKKDVNGKKFEGYSKSYGERKQNNKFKRQASQFKNSTAPILTSDLMRDLAVKNVTSNGFQLGWTSEGAKIKWLADNGRVISEPGQLVPDEMDKITNRIVNKSIDKFLGPDETTTIKV
jgi:hypothetical protein